MTFYLLSKYKIRLMLLSLFCSVVFLLPSSYGREVTFNIVHTSDLFSRYDSVGWYTGICNEGDECSGGYCRVSLYLQNLKRKYSNMILLNTGNTLSGSIFWDVYKINGALKMAKYLQKVRTVMGSRELMLGGEIMKKYITDATNVQYMGCNLRFPQGSPFKAVENKIRRSSIHIIDSDYKIGIIGFTSDTVTQTAASRKEVKIIDAITSIGEEAIRLDKRGVHVIMVFGFGSFAQAKNMLLHLPMVDTVIVGGIGGTEYSIWNVDDPSLYPVEILLRSGRRSIILHSFGIGYSRYVGSLRVTFNSKGILVRYVGVMALLNTTDYEQDEECQMDLENLAIGDIEDDEKKDYTSIDAMSVDKVGKITPVLDMLRYNCDKMECNLGNFVCDAILEYIWQEFYYGSNAENTCVALVPAYALTSNVNVSVANMADIRHAISAIGDRTITVFTIKGKDLLKVFEEVAYNVPGLQFLQVAGLQVHYDLRYEKNFRVMSAHVSISEGTLTIFRSVKRVQEIRILTLTSLLENGLISTLTAKYYNSSLILDKDKNPVKLEEILRKYLSDLESFKRPCIEDRIIVDAALKNPIKPSIIFLLSFITTFAI